MRSTITFAMNMLAAVMMLAAAIFAANSKHDATIADWLTLGAVILLTLVVWCTDNAHKDTIRENRHLKEDLVTLHKEIANLQSRRIINKAEHCNCDECESGHA